MLAPVPPFDALARDQIDDHAERGERRIWGARLSECLLGAGEVPEHDHPHDGLAYLVGGSLQECLDGVWHDVPAGRVLRQFRGRAHRLRIGATGAHVFRVRFRLDADLPDGGSLSAPPGTLGVMQQAYRQFIARTPNDLALLAWIVDAERYTRGTARTPERAPPRWLDEVEEWLIASPSAETLKAVADSLGQSLVRIHEAFERRHGCNPSEWLRRRRAYASCLRLRTSDESLSAIAFDSGYADQAHYSRSFKRYLGMSPGAYRRADRRDDARVPEVPQGG